MALLSWFIRGIHSAIRPNPRRSPAKRLLRFEQFESRDLPSTISATDPYQSIAFAAEPDGFAKPGSQIVRIDLATNQKSVVLDNSKFGYRRFKDVVSVVEDFWNGREQLLVLDRKGGRDGKGAILRVDPVKKTTGLVADNQLFSTRWFQDPVGLIREVRGKDVYWVVLDARGGRDGKGAIFRIEPASLRVQRVVDNLSAGWNVLNTPVSIVPEKLSGTPYFTILDKTGGRNGKGAIVRISSNGDGLKVVSTHEKHTWPDLIGRPRLVLEENGVSHRILVLQDPDLSKSIVQGFRLDTGNGKLLRVLFQEAGDYLPTRSWVVQDHEVVLQFTPKKTTTGKASSAPSFFFLAGKYRGTYIVADGYFGNGFGPVSYLYHTTGKPTSILFKGDYSSWTVRKSETVTSSATKSTKDIIPNFEDRVDRYSAKDFAKLMNYVNDALSGLPRLASEVERAFAIHFYLYQHLRRSFFEASTGLIVLDNAKAVCGGFTVAMAEMLYALGIKSRVAFTLNGTQGAHSMVEVFFSDGRQGLFDPTYGLVYFNVQTRTPVPFSKVTALLNDPRPPILVARRGNFPVDDARNLDEDFTAVRNDYLPADQADPAALQPFRDYFTNDLAQGLTYTNTPVTIPVPLEPGQLLGRDAWTYLPEEPTPWHKLSLQQDTTYGFLTWAFILGRTYDGYFVHHELKLSKLEVGVTYSIRFYVAIAQAGPAETTNSPEFTVTSSSPGIPEKKFTMNRQSFRREGSTYSPQVFTYTFTAKSTQMSFASKSANNLVFAGISLN